MAEGVVRAKLIADASNWRKGMAEADAATAKTEKQLSGFGKTMDTGKEKLSNYAKFAVAGLAAGAGAAIVGFLSDATKAALEDQKAQDLLALSLRNTINATDDQVASTEEWIKQTSLASGIADDELRPALSELVRRTDDLELSQSLLSTAMDISVAKGKPLQTVVEAIGKAADGQIGALGRLGVATRDAEGRQLSFKDAIAEAERTMGDASETFAESEAGTFARLNVRLEELKEEIGNGLIPILVDGAEALADFLEAIPDDPVPEETLKNLSDYDAALLHVNKQTGETATPLKTLIDSFKALGDMLGINKTAMEVYGVAVDEGERTLDEYNAAAAAGKAAQEELEGATDDVAGSFDDQLAAMQRVRDEQRALTDPLFALKSAQDELKTATDKAAVAALEHGATSPEYVAALEEMRLKAREVEDAEAEVASQMGVTEGEMRTHLQSLGVFTKQQIDLIIADFERINAFQFVPKSVTITRNTTGGGRQEFHSGGIVPGSPGTPVNTTLLAGERVVPIGHVNGNGHGGAGTIINLTVQALDPAGAAKAVVQALQSYNRTNGGVPITVRTP